MKWLSQFYPFIVQLRRGDLRSIVATIFNGLIPPKVKMRNTVLSTLSNRQGLEIGGPSRVFTRSKILPVYEKATRIDNVNFAIQTTWEQELKDGGKFKFCSHKEPGIQWIREAKLLTGIADESYDFALSSHCLEHLADPISALLEWRRVVKKDGHLLILVPDFSKTFDHKRPVTKIEHLLTDHIERVGEDDLTHLDEILALHDLKRDLQAGTPAQIRERSLRNAENRCLHHHVFNLDLLKAVLARSGWEVLEIERVRPVHLVALARKLVMTP
jgi:SAM-dependent methyltransferase